MKVSKLLRRVSYVTAPIIPWYGSVYHTVLPIDVAQLGFGSAGSRVANVVSNVSEAARLSRAVAMSSFVGRIGLNTMERSPASLYGEEPEPPI